MEIRVKPKQFVEIDKYMLDMNNGEVELIPDRYAAYSWIEEYEWHEAKVMSDISQFVTEEFIKVLEDIPNRYSVYALYDNGGDDPGTLDIIIAPGPRAALFLEIGNDFRPSLDEKTICYSRIHFFREGYTISIAGVGPDLVFKGSFDYSKMEVTIKDTEGIDKMIEAMRRGKI